MIANKIRYLKACYQADLRAVSLLNFFSKKATYQLLLDSFEPVSGELTEFPIPTEWAEKMAAHMAIYGKEKALYCGAIFLSGTVNIVGKKETMLAPLYLYPTELLEEDGIYYISIEEGDPIINPAIISALDEGRQGLLERLSDELPKGYLNFDAVDKVEKTLAKYFPEIDISLLDILPGILSETERVSIIETNKKINGKVFLPMVGLCLVEKPAGSRGILNELEEMVQEGHLSEPVQVILGNKTNAQRGDSFGLLHVPVLLSKAQETIVNDALKYPLKIIIGPPGTGKSFTIAALATEMLARGKSILIASKNVEAVEVVADKIEQHLGIDEIVVRASRKGYKKTVQVRLKNLSLGFGRKDVLQKDLRYSKYQLARINDNIEKTEKEIARQQKRHLIDGGFLSNYTDNIFQKVKKKWLEFQHGTMRPIWELTAELEKLTVTKNKSLKKYIQLHYNYYLRQAFRNSRTDILAMNKALKTGSGNLKSKYFDETNFKKILKALPVWSVRMADVHKVLPLYSELFDVVVIDEATQCDMASSMPLLQRAKSALIVGDPKQLRHLSFLSNKQQTVFARQFNIHQKELEDLNYRDNSLLDLVDEKITSQENVYFLNEHYRSMPDIISFSNKQFYAGSLHIMTDNLNTRNKKHNFIKRIKGKRNARGYNQFEADAIFQKIIELIEAEINIENHLCQSIGIISPFREQVNHLQRKAAKLLTGSQLERHRIMIGTPFSFQGEERDIIFISFALDDTSHPSAFYYLNKQEVFNVCVTRARVRQYNCISFSDKKVGNEYLFGKYLAHIQMNGTRSNSKTEGGLSNDSFLEEVKKTVQEIGVEEIIVGHEIAGVKIDLLIVKNNKSFGIDLAGYPGEYEDIITLDNWKMIYRTGVPIFYLPYSNWIFDKAAAAVALKEFIGSV